MTTVNAEKVGNRVYLRAPFKYKDQCKEILGARWSPKAKAWTYPLDLEVCRLLREAFGDELTLGTELWVWSAAEVKREQKLHGLSKVQDIDVMSEVYLPTLAAQAPTMWTAMQQRPYQPVASLYMASAKQCLNADQPGVGKTIETLGALIEGGVTGPVLILAPRTSCLVVWPAEIERWLADDVAYTVTQTAGLTPAKREQAYADFKFLTGPVAGGAPDGLHFLIANAEQAGVKKFTECPAGICDGDEDWCPEYAQHKNKSETRRPFLHSIAWSAIVADETHKWLINTRGKSASQVGYGFTKLRTVEGAPRYALSGTPLKGKKFNLFGTLNWLRPKVFTSKWRWVDQYFEVQKEVKDIGRKGTVEVRHIGDLRSSEAFFRSLDATRRRCQAPSTTGCCRFSRSAASSNEAHTPSSLGAT
jgi:hypothetical protein